MEESKRRRGEGSDDHYRSKKEIGDPLPTHKASPSILTCIAWRRALNAMASVPANDRVFFMVGQTLTAQL